MSDLRVDGDSLRDAARRIRDVVDSFSTTGTDAHDAANYVGHGGLASRVKEFADGWDVHRGKFSDELRQVADALEAVDDAFTDLDNHGAQTLRGIAARWVATAGPSGHVVGHDRIPSLSGGRDV